MKILNSYKPELKNHLGNPLEKYSQNKSLIFLLRHGQIKGCKEKRYIGQTDISLDNTGIAQAEYWQKAFTSIPINRVYSSALSRCTATAEFVADIHPIKIEPLLNEINMGTWDGKSFGEIKKENPLEFKVRGETIDTFRPPDGESFTDLSNRALPFFFQNLRKKNEENTIIVTHAGVIRTILCNILKMELKDLFQIKVSYGELFVICANVQASISLR